MESGGTQRGHLLLLVLFVSMPFHLSERAPGNLLVSIHCCLLFSLENWVINQEQCLQACNTALLLGRARFASHLGC